MPNHNGGPPNGLPDNAIENLEENLPNLPQATQDLLNELLGVGGEETDEIAFFSGRDFQSDFSTSGFEPWYFDGETAGQVIDLEPGTEPSNPTDFFLFNGDLYFQAETSAAPTRQLYKLDSSDGTVSTVQFQGADGMLPLMSPTNFIEFGDDLYFTANTSDTGTELFKIDGLTGVVDDIDIVNESGSSNPTNLTEFNDELYFTANAGNPVGNNLFKLDDNGLPVPIPGQVVLPEADLFVFDGALYFAGIPTDGAGDVVLLKLDTAGAITELDSTDAAGMTDPGLFFEFGADLYFKATRPDTGEDVFKLDGETGTITAVEVAAGVDSFPREFISAGGSLFVVASTAAHGEEVFRLNETSGQWEVADINPDVTGLPGSEVGVGSQPSELTAFNGDLYVNANIGANADNDFDGVEVHKISGVDGSIINIEDMFEAQTGFSEFTLLGAVDDQLVLQGIKFDGTFEWGLFAYDGTTITQVNDTLFNINHFTVDEGDPPIV